MDGACQVYALLGCYDLGDSGFSQQMYRQALVGMCVKMRHTLFPVVKEAIRGCYGVEEAGHRGPYSYFGFLRHFLEVRSCL